MPLSFTDVDEILRIIDLFPAAEIRFEHGDLKLYVKRAVATSAVRSEAVPIVAPAAPGESPPLEAPMDVPAPHLTPPPHAAPSVDRKGQIAVDSPLTGVFYAAPSPTSPPYVTPGQQIAQGTDLCIIEVMKLMNVIKAPCAGVIVDVVAHNGALVERGQPVMWIKPE